MFFWNNFDLHKWTWPFTLSESILRNLLLPLGNCKNTHAFLVHVRNFIPNKLYRLIAINLMVYIYVADTWSYILTLSASMAAW